jgi:hypothetical protein
MRAALDAERQHDVRVRDRQAPVVHRAVEIVVGGVQTEDRQLAEDRRPGSRRSRSRRRRRRSRSRTGRPTPRCPGCHRRSASRSARGSTSGSARRRRFGDSPSSSSSAFRRRARRASARTGRRCPRWPT